MNECQTYEEDVLKRYGLTEKVAGIKHFQNDTVQIDFEDGGRLWINPRIETSEFGIKPQIQILYQPAAKRVGVISGL